MAPQPVGFYCPEASTLPVGCSKGTFGAQPKLGDAAFCSTCPPRTTSSPGSAQCTKCVDSFYSVNTSSTAPGSFECKPCLPGGTICAEGSALATVELPPGRWRLSGASEDVVKCFISSATDSSSNTTGGASWSPCKGGVEIGFEGEGYCQVGYTGPRVRRQRNSPAAKYAPH
jgi:hypothetical protein|eukprot:3216104-Prymnesium_polylepis.1